MGGWIGSRGSLDTLEKSVEITVKIRNKYRLNKHLLYESLLDLDHHKNPFYIKM